MSPRRVSAEATLWPPPKARTTATQDSASANPQRRSHGPHRRQRCGLACYRHAAEVAAHVPGAQFRAVHRLPLRSSPPDVTAPQTLEHALCGQTHRTVMERNWPNTLISVPGAIRSPELKAFSIV